MISNELEISFITAKTAPECEGSTLLNTIKGEIIETTCVRFVWDTHKSTSQILACRLALVGGLSHVFLFDVPLFRQSASTQNKLTTGSGKSSVRPAGTTFLCVLAVNRVTQKTILKHIVVRDGGSELHACHGRPLFRTEFRCADIVFQRARLLTETIHS